MPPPRVFLPVEYVGLVEPAYESTDSEISLPAAQAACTYGPVHTRSSSLVTQATTMETRTASIAEDDRNHCNMHMEGAHCNVSAPFPVARAYTRHAVLDSTYKNTHCTHRPTDPRDPIRVTHVIYDRQQKDSRLCQNTGCKATVGR